MSKKNRRHNRNRMHNSIPVTPNLAIPNPTPFPTANAQAQDTPFFEPDPKGGLRMALSPECWCELTNLPSRVLQSDPAYQRNTKDAHVQDILRDWDVRVMNFPKVSQREDGGYYIFDGAHTTSATDKINGGREHLVPCILYHNLKLEDEAYLFAMQNGCSKEVAFGYKLNARIVGGDKKAIAFQAHNDRLGLKIVKEGKNTKNLISAVNTAYRLFDKWKGPRYLEVMSLIVDTWGADKSSLSQVVIEGVSRFFRAYSDVFDRNRFIRDLSNVSVKRLAEKSRAAMNGSAQAMANQLVQIYNRKGGKNCVKPDWLLILDSLGKGEELNIAP